MAFVVEQEKRRIAWMPILTGVLIVVFLGAGIYYLFFSEVPLIESISDTSTLEISANEFNKIKTTQDKVINHPVFKDLKQQVSNLSVGSLGRRNPFEKF